jgi:hypothetical protein
MLDNFQSVFLESLFGSLKTRRNAREFSNCIFGIVVWILKNKTESSRIFKFYKVYFWNRCLDPWKQDGMLENFQILFLEALLGSLKTRRNAGGFSKYILVSLCGSLETRRNAEGFFWVIFGGFDMAGLAELLENRRKPHCDWVMQTQTSVAVGFSCIFKKFGWPCHSKTTKNPKN